MQTLSAASAHVFANAEGSPQPQPTAEQAKPSEEATPLDAAVAAILKLANGKDETFEAMAVELGQSLGFPSDDLVTYDALSEIAFSVQAFAADCMAPFFTNSSQSARKEFARRLAEVFITSPQPDWQTTMDVVWSVEPSPHSVY